MGFIVNCLKKQWNALFGQLAGHIKLADIRGNCLVLYTNKAAWVSEVYYFKPMILDKVNALLETTELIRIKIIYQPSAWKKKQHPLRFKADTLAEAVDKRQQLRKQQGYELCMSCRVIYTKQPFCVFCRCCRGN